MTLDTKLKPSARVKAKHVARTEEKRARRWRITKALLQISAGIGVLAGIVAAVQPFTELTTTPANTAILAPRRSPDDRDSSKMILLDRAFEQRFFYFVDKRLVKVDQPFLIGFPFSIRNVGEKRLDHATISFTFEHVREGLFGSRPSLADAEWPMFADIPMKAVDLSGRSTLQRKMALSPTAASITYTGLEFLPKTEHFLEYHFAPKLYPISVAEGGSQESIGAYDVKVTVIGDGFSQEQRVRVMVVPGDSEEDFLVGVAAFSRLFGCKVLCEASWLRQQVHKVPWLAAKMTREFENVLVFPTPLYGQAPNGLFRVLRPEGNIRVQRFVQVLGAREQ